ncbi:MAG TPA: propanediol utilization protein, partial [Thermoanaerobacter sp.]|nr:propanediol utilization protein [Thermoanaerobacter sp.]
AADAAVKAGGVNLIEIRPAVGLGGKSFATMIGNISAVESAINAGKNNITEEGMILNFAIIPYISEDVLKKLI